MGTVICHPSGSSDLVSPCYRCAGTCLPGFIIDARERHEGNPFRQLKSDSMYAMTMKQPKIVVTEGHLEYQMQNKKVASSPETKSGRAERTPNRERECSSTPSSQPSCTNEQTSLPKNGKVSKEASLTIVRRSNSRKDNTVRPDPTENVASCNSADCQSQLPQSRDKSINHECSKGSISADKKLNSGDYSNFVKMQPIHNTIAPDESMTTASSAGCDDIETVDLATENLPAVDTPDACDKAAMRLRCLLRLLQRGEISAEVLQKNLHYAARVLEAVFIDETNQDGVLKDRSNTFSNETTTNAGAARTTGVSTTQRSNSGQTGPMHFSKGALQRRRLRTPVWAKPMPKMRLADEDDELSEVQPDAVPPEVREWLASTFTRQLGTIRKRSDEKPKFRSVAHAIRAGIFVDRIYRRVSNTALMQFPADVVRVLKTLDEWSFDVFALAEAANGQPVKYLGYDLLNRYGMIHKFKVPPATLELFLNKIEEGYCRFRNPYHNNLHAADVAQSVHHVLCQTGLMNWMSDLEIFATLLAAIIHDYEHTGTTNNFHVMSGSETAIIYNDRAVLENHHISAAFRVLKEDDCNILSNLSREEYRELRTLVIDMVLATDMSYHFQQLKNMRSLLSLAEPSVDKSKALSLVLHCCDISHPAKNWALHHRWTMLLLEEFFRQGDLERELGLPFSPLCDRNNTLVAESQIGFIEFIVEPSMAVCSDMLECILAPLAPVSCKNATAEENATPSDSIPSHKSCETIREGIEMAKHGSSSDENKQNFRIRKPWVTCLSDNKKIWKEQAIKDAETVTVPSNSDEKDKEQSAEHNRETTD